MSDTKMLQILINGQSKIREDISSLRTEMKEEFKKTNARIEIKFVGA